jgi:hypothetical protein
MAQTRDELVLSFMHSLASNPELLTQTKTNYAERVIGFANALADEYLKSLG